MLSRLVEVIGERPGISLDAIRKRTKDSTIGDARKIFCYVGSNLLEIPQSELEKYTGISASSVWAASIQGKEAIKKRGMIEVV